MHIIIHNLKIKDWNELKFWKYLFSLLSSNCYRKKMLLESLTISLRFLTCAIITLVYSCINIVMIYYHLHLITCFKLTLKTITITLDML